MTDARTARPAKAFSIAAAALALAALFIVIAGLVMRGDTQAFDEALLRALRSSGELSDPVGPEWLTSFAVAVTELAGTPLLTLATLVLAGWFAVRREWRMLVILLAAVLGESVMTSAMKDLFARPRPDVVAHLVHATSGSFPSGHASSAGAIFLTLAALVAAETKPRAARIYVFASAGVLAFLVAASRVYLGVHYPSDVLGGLSFGALWAAIVWIAARRFGGQALARPSLENQKP